MKNIQVLDNSRCYPCTECWGTGKLVSTSCPACKGTGTWKKTRYYLIFKTPQGQKIAFDSEFVGK